MEQNIGLSYIAAFLEKYSINAQVLELTGKKETSFSDLLSDIPEADLYGISCFSTTYPAVKAIISHIRKSQNDAFICVGGPHPTAMPKESISDLGADAVVCGEGETAFLEIAKAVSKGVKPKGIFIGDPSCNLDEFPFPVRPHASKDYHSRIFHEKKNVSLISSRGCKYRCLHCNSIIMGGGSNTVRFRSTDNIIEEIQYLKEQGYENFRFNDDNFGDNPNLYEMLTAMEKEKVTFRIFSRIEHLDRETLARLQQSGCDFINIGLESLNRDNLRFLRKEKMLRHLDNLDIASEMGITIRASFMVGLPYDTDLSVKNAFMNAVVLPFDEFAVYPLLPYPGTVLWERPEAYGYEIVDRDFTRYIQIGVNQFTCFALKHTDPNTGYTFYPSDVERWLHFANDCLLSSKLHMKNSTVAK